MDVGSRCYRGGGPRSRLPQRPWPACDCRRCDRTPRAGTCGGHVGAYDHRSPEPDGVLFVLIFPDGRLKSSRWRLLVVLVILDVAADLLVGLDDPYPLRVGPQQWVPVSLPSSVWPIGASIGFASGAVGWARPGLAVLVATYLLLRL